MIIALITSVMSFLGKAEVLNENVLIQIIPSSLREDMNLECMVMFYSRGGPQAGTEPPQKQPSSSVVGRGKEEQ